MLAELSHKEEIKRNLLKKWYKNIIFRSLQIVVKLYHTNFSSNADSDLNENGGGLTDLAKNSRDRRICVPLFTPSCQRTVVILPGFGSNR